MQITGTYNNYLNMTNLLSTLGVKGSGNLIMQVFTNAVGNLQSSVESQIFSDESAKALEQLYDEVSLLAHKAANLTLDGVNSVFYDRTATSSDSNVLTATAYDAFSQDSGATEATYNISVDRLAKAQENNGMALNQADSSVVNTGTNTFNINMNGQDHEISIEVAEGETNETVLQKIATAINGTGIALTAQVMAGSETGTQQLVINADNTGLANAFTISDVAGNAAAATGADMVTFEAQDASYMVDGAEYTSDANTIYLDDGMVTVNLEGEGESSLTVAPDENQVINAISAMLSGVSNFTDFLENNDDYINNEVISTVNSQIADHKMELESIGIAQGEDGGFEIDDMALSDAISQDISNIKNIFGGFDGLAVQIDSYTSRIANDSPLNYVKGQENMGVESIDYLYTASLGMSQKIIQASLLDTYV